ncbi:MAG: AAA family ATPase [Candidatus Accumulibacter sp.]|jgi:type II secretory pathway predicted ATPase ExeA|nr:AAA family ATPase [Accumulibacter sp.]
MYLEHFGLREAPFRITPHTDFFFPGAERKATLEALIYATTHDEGIVKVSGEVGSGKTMLCRMLLETLPETVTTVYFANPLLSHDEILDTLAEELGMALPEKRPRRLLRTIQDRLIDLYAEGRQVVVMVDEAHAMPRETLEEIRLLSNLESKRHKLLHIVLFGQPELDERLLEPAMRPLKERITHNFALSPLYRDDIGEYLMFRLRRAGYHGPDIFTPDAISLISRASEGLTRRINILADKALLSAFSENKHMIHARQIKAAIEDAQFNPMGGPVLFEKWLAGAFIAFLVAIVFSLAYFRNESPSSAPPGNASSSGISASRRPPSPLPGGASDAAPSAGMPLEFRRHAPENRKSEAISTPALEERIAATDKWLMSTPDSHFFIQLFSAGANNRRAVELFLEQARALDQPHIRVYRSKLSGHERYGVIYGDYPSLEAAKADFGSLESAYSLYQPYIRSVAKLR